jgi:thioredoxin 1
MGCGNVTERDFRKLVLENDDPVLVVFTAGFCEESQKLLSVMNEVADAYEGRARVVNHDLGKDETQARSSKLAQRYRVNRLPVAVMFSEGRPKDYIGGLSSRADIADMIDRQLRPVREVIGERNFRQEVLESKAPVLVHFHAAECSASLDLLPIVESTAENFRGRAKVVRVEANVFNAALMERYGAIRLPVLAAFDAGEMRDCILGTIVEPGLLAEKDGSRAALDHVGEMMEELV